jgi:hypothetical protein
LSKHWRNPVRTYRRISLFALGLLAFALAPATAMAGGASDAQYSSSLEQISGASGGGSSPGAVVVASATDPTATSGLPFTGLDLALLVSVAGGLLLAGIVLRSQRPVDSRRS